MGKEYIPLKDLIENYKVYHFYWEEGGFIVLIPKDISVEKVKKLLKKYKEEHFEDYNSDDFIDYLNENGVEAVGITGYTGKYVDVDADEHIYF